MIDQVRAAQETGSWVVFGFHGIGGDWEVTPAESHEELLLFLKEEESNLTIAPFGEIAACLKP
jgi:hypothetical protein